MKTKNQPVGEVECDRKGCAETCKVFKFRPRAEGRRTVFTDKYYFECPVHGRRGSDGNQSVTDYVLEHGKIWSNQTDHASADASQKNRPPARAPAASTGGQSSRTGNASAGNQPAHTAAPAKPTRSGWAPLIDLD